jgi:hypothetical protein
VEAGTAYLMAMLTGGNAPVACQTDPTSYTPGNVTAGTALTKAWPMLGSTPVAGTVYELSVDFTATFEGNAMAFGVFVNGAFTQMNPAVAATAFTAGTVLSGWLNLAVRVQSASTARFRLAGAVSETTVSVTPSTGSIAYSPLSQTLTVAAAYTVSIGALFGASTSGQGLATYGSYWTTLGSQV